MHDKLAGSYFVVKMDFQSPESVSFPGLTSPGTRP